MTIVPDTKDWTWVLREPCAECGLVASELDPRTVADLVRGHVARWETALARPDARDRPAPDVWSTTEYACHVRDVFTLFAERVRLMLDHDDPEFANWDQDVTAIEDDYAGQAPDVVARELAAAAEVVATTFESVPRDGWYRVGRRSNGSVFTVATLAQYFAHDVVHHLHDVDA